MKKWQAWVFVLSLVIFVPIVAMCATMEQPGAIIVQTAQNTANNAVVINLANGVAVNDAIINDLGLMTSDANGTNTITANAQNITTANCQNIAIEKTTNSAGVSADIVLNNVDLQKNVTVTVNCQNAATFNLPQSAKTGEMSLDIAGDVTSSFTLTGTAITFSTAGHLVNQFSLTS